ncbi:hypothetical protein JCM11491_003687 [Sporobolomyces phaffii]
MDPHGDPNFPPNLEIFPSSSETHGRPVDSSSTSDSLKRAQSDPAQVDAEQDIETYGIAGRTWEAAYLLRQYLTPLAPTSPVEFDPPSPLALHVRPAPHRRRQRVILEIGSGTGFLGLSIAPHLVSSDTLVVTDLENVCPLLMKNLAEARRRWETTEPKAKNSPTILVRPLPWGDATFLDREVKQPRLEPDIILASDLVYFPFLYPPLLRTLLGLTEWRASDDPRRQNPTLVFSYKIRSLVREQPFWEAFGRWFKFEPVQMGRLGSDDKESEEDGTEEEHTDAREGAKAKRAWSRLGASRRSGTDDTHLCRDDSDELFVFIARRRDSTLGISDLISHGGFTDEDLMLGRNGLEGDLAGGTRFEEMLLASLEWD